ICMHRPDAGCTCRKPQPGLVLALAADYGIDLQQAVFIGDTLSDQGCAQAAGVGTFVWADAFFHPSPTHTEIEARFLDIDVPATISRLHRLGAQDLGEDLLRETIFYDQELAWQQSGRTLVRVRESRDGVVVSYKDAV